MLVDCIVSCVAGRGDAECGVAIIVALLLVVAFLGMTLSVVLMLDVVLLVTVFLAIVLLFVELFTVLLVGGLLGAGMIVCGVACVRPAAQLLCLL